MRLAGGVEQNLRVVRNEASVLYVTSERRFQEAAEQGKSAVPLAGIPLKDIEL